MAKDFKIGNPAERFITAPIQNTPEPAEQRERKAPATVQNEPKQEETATRQYRIVLVEKRTERLQLLVAPTLKAKLKAAAQEQGKSVNDLIHNILENNL